MFSTTTRGGLILGSEALVLQGLPINKLWLTLITRFKVFLDLQEHPAVKEETQPSTPNSTIACSYYTFFEIERGREGKEEQNVEVMKFGIVINIKRKRKCCPNWRGVARSRQTYAMIFYSLNHGFRSFQWTTLIDFLLQRSSCSLHASKRLERYSVHQDSN